MVIHATFERRVGGYVVTGAWECLSPDDDAQIVDVFINGSPHDAGRLIDPALLEMWEAELTVEAAERREDARCEAMSKEYEDA